LAGSDLVVDLAFIAQQAAQRHDDYAAFRYYVEDDERSDAALDTLVESIAQPIIAAIDCTTCANCCRNLAVYLTPQDAEQLATGLALSPETLHSNYIDSAAAVEEWGVLRQRPCAFLGGALCSVYAHRPESCRAYPEFTPDFRWQLGHILGGVGLCPIIYHVIEGVKDALKW